ncbi:MAG: response regulator [Pseudomonadota bacterium]
MSDDELLKKKWLTPNEVAQLMMVSPTTVRQWAQSGKLKARITPGGHRRFLPRDIEVFARERGVTLHSGDGAHELRILVVDDDEQFGRFLKTALKDSQSTAEVATACSGFEAGQMMESFLPDVVLLDLLMPGVNGFDVCRQLKADERWKNTRVIAMTGYYAQENVEQIMAAGAESCLAKPISIDDLYAAIGLDARSE